MVAKISYLKKHYWQLQVYIVLLEEHEDWSMNSLIYYIAPFGIGAVTLDWREKNQKGLYKIKLREKDWEIGKTRHITILNVPLKG
jgi:CRISPR/Cas system-associated exonuclease Cas4 (RecB family)